MNKILETFKKPKVFLPVVHCIDRKQADQSVAVAIDHGADGVFLINQGGLPVADVLQIAVSCARAGLRVGVNVLGICAESAVEVVAPAATLVTLALWADEAGIKLNDPGILVERALHDPLGLMILTATDLAEGAFAAARAQHGWSGLYFGGVAFKYPTAVPDHLLGVAASRAKTWVDVITTSGPATGSPPSVEKVKLMRDGIGDHALAIASGITPDNVSAFLPYVEAFLVATGIESSFGVFDPARVRALADAIHGS
jgi:predicted TIM-barrel enzyme